MCSFDEARFLDHVASARAVICNGGYTLIAEALQLSHRAEGVTTEPWRHPLWHARAELRLLRRTMRARRPGGA